MEKKYVSFKKLYFSDLEHPTSSKFNIMLNLLEDVRLNNGPYTISKTAQNTTDFDVELLEDATEIGGLVLTGGGVKVTNRLFTIFYETRATVTSDYACWDNVYFRDTGDGRLIATLESSNNIYNNAVDVSSVSSDALYVRRSSGYYQ